nr:glycoside hydrolase [Acidobacteriota bacterium]
DTNYLAHASKTTGRIPVFRDITIRNVRVEGAGKVTLEALDDAHRLGIQFDNVVFDSPDKIKISAKHADVKAGPGAFNLNVTGDGVKVEGKPGAAAANACSGRFVPFPAID